MGRAREVRGRDERGARACAAGRRRGQSNRRDGEQVRRVRAAAARWRRAQVRSWRGRGVARHIEESAREEELGSCLVANDRC